MVENNSHMTKEDKLNQSYELWINHQITDQQYFREVAQLKGKSY